jgi:hypothetical protein
MNPTQRVERTIIRRAVLDLIHAGYSLNVNNGGDDPELPQPSRTCREVMEALFATDDEHLMVYNPDGSRCGWVYLVHGNGWCVISDYTTNLDEVLKGASDLADKFC